MLNARECHECFNRIEPGVQILHSLEFDTFIRTFRSFDLYRVNIRYVPPKV